MPASAVGSPVTGTPPMFVAHMRDKRCWAHQPGSFPGGDRLARKWLRRWLLPWPIRFRVEQVGDQFAVGDEHDPGEQRQHVGQHVGVSPMSEREKRYARINMP